MNAKRQLIFGSLAMATLIGLGAVAAAAAPATDDDMAALLGRPADVAPAAYLYRGDRPADANPAETTFLFAGAVGHKRDGVICGLLWEEPRPICRVELTWPKDAKRVPRAEDIVVRWIPHGDSSSWWSRRGGAARSAPAPQAADDGRTLVYTVSATQPASAMDNLVVALRDGVAAPAEPYSAPTVRAFVPDGWKLMDIEIEWGFQAGTEKKDYFGGYIVYNGLAGRATPLTGDIGTKISSDDIWHSLPAAGPRRGVAFRLLYLGPTQNTPVWRQQARLEDASRTIVTISTRSGSFSFLPADLETGPILAPEYGFFVRATARRQAQATPAGPADEPVVMESRATTAREFVKELAAHGGKTVRQRVREHEEQTWDAAMRALNGEREFPPYPKPDFEPPAKIDVPDRRLVDAWRCGAWHILRVLKKDANGRIIMRDYPYDALAHETHLIIRALDLAGMHKEATEGLARWLQRDETQPIKLDGQFADTVGILGGVEWDWQHLGGPGLMQWTMVEHYLLTADKEWLATAAPKLKANADWMIRQRRAFLKDVPGRERAWCRGLLPPHNIWDSTNWRLWYESNANYWVGLKHYADAIAKVDPAAGARYRAEADAYAKDILEAVDKSLTLSPVIRVGDGTYRSFLPPCPYMRGPASRHMPTSFGSPEHTPGLYADAIRGGAHLLHLSGLLPGSDPRAQGIADVLEDRLLLEHHRLPMRTKGYDPAKHWFGGGGWYYQCGIERTPNIHLAWDDAPNFLRSFYNHYAVDIVVGPYTFNEHTTRGPEDKSYEESAFLERLRDMLVMERGEDLWLARATPRAWLAQGGKVAAKDMPTRFGAVSYEIVSDAEHGKIAATVEVPARTPPTAVVLRLRHPKATPIKAVTVNGREWKDFDPAKEVIRLTDLKGTVKVEAAY